MVRTYRRQRLENCNTLSGNKTSRTRYSEIEDNELRKGCIPKTRSKNSTWCRRNAIATPLQPPFPTAVEHHVINENTDTCPPFLLLNYDTWTPFNPTKSIPPEASLDFANGCARIPENWQLHLVSHQP